MHAPTLPSLPSWDSPIAASRDIVEAIADAADSAVDAATSAVRSARRRRRSAPKSLWFGFAALVIAGAAAVFVRARRARGGESTGSPEHVEQYASGAKAERPVGGVKGEASEREPLDVT